MSQPRTFAFVSPKGGTGKTFFLLNAAHLLRNTGHKVLVIDLDIVTKGASGLTNYLSYEEQSSPAPRNAIADSFLAWKRGKQSHDELPEPTRWALPNSASIDILFGFSSNEPTGLQELWSRSRLLGEFLRDVLAHRGQGYDFVLVDTPGGRGPIATAAAVHCERTVVITEPGMVFWEMLKHLLHDLSKGIADNARPQTHTLLPSGAKRTLSIMVNKGHPLDDLILQRSFESEQFDRAIQRTFRRDKIQLVPYCVTAIELYKSARLPAAVAGTTRYSLGLSKALKGALDLDFSLEPRFLARPISWTHNQLAKTRRALFRHWHSVYAIAILIAALWTLPAIPPGDYSAPPYLLVFLILVLPAAVTTLALGFAFIRALKKRFSFSPYGWNLYFPSLSVAGCAALIAFFGLVTWAVYDWLQTPSHHAYVHALESQADARDADLSALAATQKEKNSLNAYLLLENRMLALLAADKGPLEERIESLQDELQTLKRATAKFRSERDELLDRLSDSRTQVDRLRRENDSYRRIARPVLIRLDEQRRDFEREQNALAASPGSTAQVRRTLDAARAYLDVVSERRLSYQEYGEEYLAFKKATQSNVGARHQEVWHVKLENLGARAFENQDLGWAGKFLSEWLAWGERHGYPADANNVGVIYFVAVLAATGGNAALDETPYDVQARLKDILKKGGSYQPPKDAISAVNVVDRLLSHNSERAWFNRVMPKQLSLVNPE